MSTLESSKPIIAIVGSTASGKSALAMRLAKEYNGEIICADSRTIYKGLDIGTAKPSGNDRVQIPHHCLDLVNPDQKFSAGEFKHRAEQAIKDIQDRNKLPIMVGGSGLYIDSVLFDYQFSKPGAERDEQNSRHLKKAESLESKVMMGSTLVLGLHVEKETLSIRIEQRVEEMLRDNLVDEVQNLLKKYEPDAPGMLAPGYKEFALYLKGQITFEEAKMNLNRAHKLLAKRQITWFKRNKNIIWVQTFEQADREVAQFLLKFDTIHP